MRFWTLFMILHKINMVIMSLRFVHLYLIPSFMLMARITLIKSRLRSKLSSFKWSFIYVRLVVVLAVCIGGGET